MDSQIARIQPGWEVVGSDGDRIGTVTEVHEDLLVVEAGTLMKHNLYIPIDHVRPADDGSVAVDVIYEEADRQGWRVPPTAHREQSTTPYPDTTMIHTAGYRAGTPSAPEAQGYVDDGLDSDEEPIPNAMVTPEGTDRPGEEDRE